ncbi:MAG: hypothetical protein EOO74_02515, partial [Myxococcales bacterium]
GVPGVAKTLTPGTKHLVRFIEMGTDDYFHVSLDDHPFQIVGADFSHIVPYTTPDLTLGMYHAFRTLGSNNHTDLLSAIGQSYDIVISANQATIPTGFVFD